MISIVIPVYNEVESLEVLYEEIVTVARANDWEIEVCFIDDGSSDDSWASIEKLSRDNDSVHGVRFRRNFGKAAALSAGFHNVHGDIVMTLDADLQDNPNEIPRFLEALAQGQNDSGPLDVISGWKRVRHDPWHKVIPSRIFNGMVSWLTGVPLHDHNCGMKCYRSEVFKEIKLYGELHRFIPVLAAARGFKVGEIEINHRERKFGYSKYGVRRFIKGFLDLLTVKFLTGFGQRPQHMLGSIGLLSFFGGCTGLLYLCITWILRLWHPTWFDPLHQRALLPYSLTAVLLGAQMMSIGFLAEMITAYQSKDEDQYSIAQRTYDPHADEPAVLSEDPPGTPPSYENPPS